MSFAAFIRAIFCLPTRTSSHDGNKAKQKRRQRYDQPRPIAQQLPARRWCDPVESKPEPAILSASPATYDLNPRIQQLVPAKPLRKPVNPHAAPYEATMSYSPMPLRKPVNAYSYPIQKSIPVPRMPVPPTPRVPSPIPYIQTILEVQQVKEVITILGKSFPHFPCVVTGLAAMVHHGFKKRLPKEVSITFPVRYRDVVRSWALSQGFLEIQGKPDLFGVTLSDGQIRCVRARFLNEGYENIRFIKAGDRGNPTRVINLQTIAVNIASGYIAELRRARLQTQEAFASDMRWALRTIDGLRQVLRPFYARHIARHEFWVPFTLSFPDTVPLFANVRLGPDEVEALQDELRQDAEVEYSLMSPYGSSYGA